jgi:tripartite-type tricarboxylate transporter receptor subunit TctC
MAVWYGAYGPAGMPNDIVARLNAEIGRILFLPEVKKRMEDIAVETARSSPEELAAMTRADAEKWGGIIRQLGITGQ